jgi:hypothetical protein
MCLGGLSLAWWRQRGHSVECRRRSRVSAAGVREAPYRKPLDQGFRLPGRDHIQPVDLVGIEGPGTRRPAPEPEGTLHVDGAPAASSAASSIRRSCAVVATVTGRLFFCLPQSLVAGSKYRHQQRGQSRPGCAICRQGADFYPRSRVLVGADWPQSPRPHLVGCSFLQLRRPSPRFPLGVVSHM